MGHTLSIWLIGFYIVLACVFLYERDYARAWYWLGAAQIVSSVLMMKS